MAFEKYLPKILREFLLERRRSRATWKAILLASEKRFAEAARIYSDFADQHLAESTLQYSTHCEYAMENWIEAKQPQEALEQARRALRSFGNDDGEWMRYSSGDYAGALVKMATKLHTDGFTAEAETFAREVNEQLEKYNVPFRCLLDPAEKNEFPSICTQCGGSLPYSTHQQAIECPFCEILVYARQDSPG